MVEGITVGRIVHYVAADGPEAGQCRAAIITRVHSRENGCVNLAVFADSEALDPIRRTSVLFSTALDHTHGCWHWPERE